MTHVFYQAHPALPSVLVVGSAEDCHIRIVGDDYVSGHHCRLRLDTAGAVWVEDLGSTNGTYIDAPAGRVHVVAPRVVRPGDALVVGRTRIPWTPETTP